MTPSDTRSIMDTWLRPVEQIVLPALDSKIRVLGFTSPHHGAGVSTLAAAAAETVARSGLKVLLIDFTCPVEAVGSPASWTPGEGGAQAHIHSHSSGFDVLPAVATMETRSLFNNGKRVRRTLFEDLSDYAVIVADLPPLLEERHDYINPVAVALACDQVLLVCANGLTQRTTARAAIDVAKAGGVRLTGAIWNHFGAPSVGVEMARSARRFFGFLPPVARALERRLQGSTFLNH